MGILGDLGIEVKNQMDRLEDDDIVDVADWFDKYPDGIRPAGESAIPEEAPEPADAPADEQPESEEAPAPAASVEKPVAPQPTMPPVFTAAPVMPPVAPPPAPVIKEPVEEKPAEAEQKTEPEKKPEPVKAEEEKPVKPVAEQKSVESQPEPKPVTPARKGKKPAETAERPPVERKPESRPKPAQRQQKPSGSEESAGQASSRGDSRSRGRQQDDNLDEKRRSGRKTTSTGKPAGREPRAKGFTIGAASNLAEQTGAGGSRKRRGKRRKKKGVSQAEIQASVQRTLSEMGRGRVKKSYDRRAQTENEEQVEDQSVLKVSEFVSVSELADLMEVGASEVISSCLTLGLMVSRNQRLEMETIQIIAEEFGFEVEQLADKEVNLEPEEEEDNPEDLKPRPPVVTVMGHVDHGKTSLLDYIRRANVIADEAGGITQHIGAYVVKTANGDVTFLDTPGHEAFTAMRSRGTQVTDVVVLIIAADDNVMPQTIEAINHAKAAGVPIVVAINKVDLPGANPARIKQELTAHDVIVEEFGGSYQCCEISAKIGTGVDGLLETLALETELLELSANPDRRARGAVIEARLDRGRGAVATVLVESGTLEVGDSFTAGMASGRVRAMLDERGERVESAGPSRPVQVLGFDDVPAAGDSFVVYEDEREARQIAQHRQQLRREQEYNRIKKVSLADLHRQIAQGEIRTLPVIVKGDVDGSVEALSDELGRLSNDEVGIEVIHRAVGAITEGDVLLASASNAIIVGFHVRPEARARELASQEQVEIHLYNVIYEAIDDVKNSLSGLLEARVVEEITSTVEVRDLFKIPRVGTVAGCYVRSGTVTRGSRIRVIREGTVAYTGRIGTLRRIKDDVREVQSGYECGIWVEGFNDVKVGDTLETFSTKEEARVFESAAD